MPVLNKVPVVTMLDKVEVSLPMTGKNLALGLGPPTELWVGDGLMIANT